MDIPKSTNEAIKFSPEEIKFLAEIRDNYEQVAKVIGRIHMQMRELHKEEKKIEEKLVELENSERKFLDEIIQKYGEGTYSPETGIFTPTKK